MTEEEAEMIGNARKRCEERGINMSIDDANSQYRAGVLELRAYIAAIDDYTPNDGDDPIWERMDDANAARIVHAAKISGVI